MQSTFGRKGQSQASSVLRYLQRTRLDFRTATKIVFSVVMKLKIFKLFNLQQSGIFLSQPVLDDLMCSSLGKISI